MTHTSFWEEASSEHRLMPRYNRTPLLKASNLNVSWQCGANEQFQQQSVQKHIKTAQSNRRPVGSRWERQTISKSNRQRPFWAHGRLLSFKNGLFYHKCVLVYCLEMTFVKAKVRRKNGNKAKPLLPMSESPPPQEFNLRNISCFFDFTIGEVFSSLVKKEGR